MAGCRLQISQRNKTWMLDQVALHRVQAGKTATSDTSLIHPTQSLEHPYNYEQLRRYFSAETMKSGRIRACCSMSSSILIRPMISRLLPLLHLLHHIGLLTTLHLLAQLLHPLLP